MIRAVDSKSSVRTCFIIWSISIRATICMGDYMAYWHEVYTTKVARVKDASHRACVCYFWETAGSPCRCNCP